MTDPRMVTDLNDRERARLIATLESMRANAEDLISALESGDDSKLAVPGMMFMLALVSVQDLFKALATAQYVDMSDLDHPLEESGEGQD